MTADESVPGSGMGQGTGGTGNRLPRLLRDDGLPQIWWSPWRGWLYAQDPVSGEVHAIWYKDAPWGWSRIASREKEERNARMRRPIG